VTGDNVRTVLAWVAANEADAASSMRPTQDRTARAHRFLLRARQPPADCLPAAVLRDAPGAQEAAGFLAFCRSPEGQALFRAAGFSAVPLP